MLFIKISDPDQSKPLLFDTLQEMPVISIKPWSEAITEALPIRITVFVQEQGVPKEMELDEFDVNADHALVHIGPLCVGTARLVRLADKKVQIGRIAVLDGQRGNGIGSKLLKALLDLGRSQGIEEFELHAQVAAINFYAKLGFSPLGEIYDEAGIPHRNMILLLK
jgi:predicted GNAT family N-acyltransferase